MKKYLAHRVNQAGRKGSRKSLEKCAPSQRQKPTTRANQRQEKGRGVKRALWSRIEKKNTVKIAI